MTLAADLVLLAIGFEGATPGGLFDELGVSRGARSKLSVDAEFATDVPGIFAAGDAVRGASLTVGAIADGGAAACSCDRYLSGATRLR